MASGIPYFIVDVFAEAPLHGNPLAVVPDADGLDAGLMARIAAEFNLSETTFVLRPERTGADHRLRSFTPGAAEVFGAGHNALGAWWWLAASGRLGDIGSGRRLGQQLGDDVLPVTIAADGTVGMVQKAPAVVGGHGDRAALAAALGLGPADLVGEAVTISAGSPHLLVEIADRAAVDRAAPDARALLGHLRAAAAQGCYLYSLDGPEAAHARFFNPTVGILEDPATGSAAGPLAWHLGRRGLVPWGTEVVIRQGVAMGRPSRLAVGISPDGAELRGSAVLVASGVLHIR